MERPEQTDAQIREKARQAGLIEHFMIANLHGYRTVSMDTPNAAAILIAPNGAGKTTLIGALNAVLKGQFARLQNIDFDFIEIKLSNTNSHRIYKSDINNVVERSLSSEFISQASKYDIKPNQLFEYLLHAYNREEARQSYYNTTTLFDNIAKGEGYSLERALDVADRLTASLFAGSESLELVRSEIEESLRDIEILYLPTYRRIELSLAEDETYPHRRKRPDIKFSKDSLFSGTIQFGMADISDQLMKLNNEVLAESNEGYRRISAKIINDLIEGRFPNNLPNQGNLPSQDELRIFFSRISKAAPRFRPYYANDIPNLDRLYQSTDNTTSNQFLNYFLGYLNEVISRVSKIEDNVTHFITTCNKYLGTYDPSTDFNIVRRYRSPSVDPKELILDRSDMTVSVKSTVSNKDIPIESLSSGEKQMISLFGKMLLYDKPKVVLIDEPELSLSLDWQTQILSDILAAPTCQQLIAITHSPFVFENALEPFARTVDLKISNGDQPNSNPQLD